MTDAKQDWKVGTDMFAAVHVYNEHGERLTNDRMSGTEGWPDIAALIAAAPATAAERDALKAENAELVEEFAHNVVKLEDNCVSVSSIMRARALLSKHTEQEQ